MYGIFAFDVSWRDRHGDAEFDIVVAETEEEALAIARSENTPYGGANFKVHGLARVRESHPLYAISSRNPPPVMTFPPRAMEASA